jgi:LysM repeat protein
MFPRLVLILIVVAALLGGLVRTVHGAGPPRVYVVKPADTLWSIASRNYHGDPREAVWQIEQRNGLASAVLRPGERLVLP